MKSILFFITLIILASFLYYSQFLSSENQNESVSTQESSFDKFQKVESKKSGQTLKAKKEDIQGTLNKEEKRVEDIKLDEKLKASEKNEEGEDEIEKATPTLEEQAFYQELDEEESEGNSDEERDDSLEGADTASGDGDEGEENDNLKVNKAYNKAMEKISNDLKDNKEYQKALKEVSKELGHEEGVSETEVLESLNE